ncbi:Plexin repeat family protein [Trichomonas vaginalis G3]|uniref:Plexin repeat family protein n=1 Tax=Trichomonas vaginalis (strain ATCC PRA-98 / G3) TaxID=412133 RepID=A2EIN5_TRIV3|nr:hypothetical protein TVAGG3_0960110 [Trichomonas vaginalis G3]EAY07462.1 Plexin repeat family protein [Trichomonas vaginalis G3]KAI5487842.1 hypothetical protein TVAGG3_0960110 [Trichomonas vaginalis G3]|eukprot:XP_001319685.1 Plexin repeat family protein [Trichomonas vaginalis G3]
MFYLLALAPIFARSEECPNFSSNCETCLGLGKDKSCGWCSDSNSCLVGTSDGPTNATCTIWTFKFDMKCHIESQEPLPMGARIGLAVFAALVALITAVFWICIFPHCSNQKKVDKTQTQEEDDE